MRDSHREVSETIVVEVGRREGVAKDINHVDAVECRDRHPGLRDASDDPVEEVELGKRSSAPTKASSLPAASNLPPAERPSSDDDAGSAEEWEARDGGGFELRINS